MRYSKGWAKFALGLIALSGSIYAHAQMSPRPPTGLCATGAACLSQDSSNVSVGKKWHPGHYVKTQGNHAPSKSGVQSYVNDVTRQLGYTTDSNQIRGALVSYSWGMLEPRRGQYDWSPVYRHLDWLASRGKRLLINVETKCFRTKCETLSPQNLQAENITTNSGFIAPIWRRHVMDQLIAFSNAFAAEFDNHPYVEMVGVGGESCPSFGGVKVPKDYSHKTYANELMRLQNAQSKAYRRTHVHQMINCDPGQQFAAVLESAYQRNLARSSPDSHNDPGAMLFRGRNGAVRDYRGRMPHLTYMSQPNLGGKDSLLPMSNVVRQVNDLGITHIAWITTSKSPNWKGIVSVLESNQIKLTTTLRR